MATATRPRHITAIEPMAIVNKSADAALIPVLDDALAKQLGIDNIDELRAELEGADGFKVSYSDGTWETYLASVDKAAAPADPFGQKFHDEQLAWLDGYAKEHGLETARKLAEVNKATSWGKAWLEKHAAAVQKSDAESVEKAAEVALRKATEDLYSFAKKRAAELGIKARDEQGALGALLNQGDEETWKLADVYQKARLAKLAASTTAPAAAITAEIEKLESEEAADVERFAIAHNLDSSFAKTRLLTLSKSAAERSSRIAELHGERRAVYQAAEHASAARGQLEQLTKAEQAASLENQSQLAMQKARGPAGRRLVEHVTELARKSGKPFDATMNEAIVNDPVATALYQTSREER